MGLGMLLGGLAGAGNALADSASQSQKFSDEQALMRERAALEEQKQLRIDEVMRQRNAAPLNRLQESAQRFSQEDVPVTADPVTQTTSAGAKAAGLQDGLVGMTREQVAAYKNPEMLAQYDKQIAADNKLAQDAVAGKTRKRTSDEAFDAAMNNAQTNDLEAYKAGVGLLGAKKDIRKMDNEERRLDQAEKRQADLDKYQNRREDRLDKLAEMQITRQEIADGKLDLREESALRRSKIDATKAALAGVNNDIKALEKDAADPMLSEAQKQVVNRQLSAARNEAQSYREALSAAGLEVKSGSQDKSQDNDPLGIRKSFTPQPKKQSSEQPAKSTNQAIEQPKTTQKQSDSINVSDDVVLKSLNQQIANLNPSDPNDMQKVIAIGNARNARLKQLQEKYGSMSKLTGY